MGAWEDDGHCYVCGKHNPEGFQVAFTLDERGVETSFRAEKRHQGYRDVLHGGILAMLLDEVMVQLPYMKFGDYTVNAEFGVKLIRPVPVGSRVRVRAAFDGPAAAGQRMFRLTAEAILEDGTVAATAWGKCVRPRP